MTYSITDLYKKIAHCYKEDHRVFHNLDHINKGFESIEEYESASATVVGYEQKVAWLFHDIIYKPENTDNETKSVMFLVEFNEKHNLGLTENQLSLIIEIILNTESHIPTCEESKVILDIDMISLGLEWNCFLAERKKIINEYSPYYSEHVIAKGFLGFSKNYIEKNISLFQTDYFKNKYEEQAKSNLERFSQLLHNEILDHNNAFKLNVFK